MYIPLPLTPSLPFLPLILILSLLHSLAKCNERMVVNVESDCVTRADIDIHVTHVHISTVHLHML